MRTLIMTLRIECDRCPAHEDFDLDLVELFSGRIHPIRKHLWYKSDLIEGRQDDLCEACYDGAIVYV